MLVESLLVEGIYNEEQRVVEHFVFRKWILAGSQVRSMDPPQTKKQYIKNQKEKGASSHRLGTKKHVRQSEQRKRTR